MGIRELASHLGISIGTVSRALNGKPDVSPKTRERVLQAAREFGYSPNQAGRNLRRGRTGVIAALLPSRSPNLLANSIFLDVVAGVQEFTEAEGLDLVLILCGQRQDPLSYVRRVVERQVADGVILTDTLQRDARIEYLAEQRVPFVTFGRSESGSGFSWIDLDFESAISDSVSRLAARGHKRIAMILPNSNINYNHILVPRFEEAAAASGAEFDPQLVFKCPTGDAGADEAAARLLKNEQPPTAILLIDAAIGPGLYRRLADAGRPAGTVTEVIGLVDAPPMQYLTPGMSAYGADRIALGRELGQAAIAALGQSGAPQEAQSAPTQMLWPMTLVERASTRTIRAA